MAHSQLADHLFQRLHAEKGSLQQQFSQPDRIPTFVLDDVLPVAEARRIYDAFPAPSAMMAKRSLRESKSVAAQMDRYDPLLEQAVYAFQDPRVVDLLTEITGSVGLLPDARLYAGGISLMSRGDFLNPHLDNSHDGQGKLYRALNLLFYVSPNWQPEYGGNLELWDGGLERRPRVVPSAFNRLVAMATDTRSIHSVDPIRHDGRRCCISNYYFSATSVTGTGYFHATSFYGRPGQRLRDLALRGDNMLRTAILKYLPGAYRNPHIYQRPRAPAR